MSKIYILFLVSFLWLSSCNNNNTTTPTDSKSVTVYAAGHENNKAMLWKNGTPTIIAEDGIIYAIQVVGDDVYLAGTSGNNAVYWKNGIATKLTNSKNGANIGSAFTIAVVGSDVYVAGFETDASNVRVAKYWKNGVAINITDGTYNAVVNQIVVRGTDVYACGWESTIAGVSGSGEVAKLWKNGIATQIANMSHATSMAVVENDVHVVGYKATGTGTDTAKYWKNGAIVTLPSAGIQSHANSLYIDGTDVYIGGSDNRKAAYWKNGTIQTIGADYTSIESIYISGSDVYAGGFFIKDPGGFPFNGLHFWKNGTLTAPLPPNESRPSSRIFSVFVTK